MFKLVALFLATMFINQAVDEEQDDVSFLVPLFLDGTLSSEFFVSQLDSVDLKKDVLIKTSGRLKNEWKKAIANLNGKSSSDVEKEAHRLRFKENAENLIDESLTPEQLKAISKLAKQRRQILEARCRNFELPVFFAVKALGDGKKPKNLKLDFASIKNSYEEKKSEEFGRCIEKFKDAGVTFKGFDELVELHQNVEKIDTRSLSRRPDITIDWGDDQFADYQSDRQACYLNNSNSMNLAPLLGMTEAQIQQVKLKVQDSRASRNPDDFVDPNYARIILAVEDNSMKVLQSEIKRKLELTNRLERDLADEIANTVLLPHQVKVVDRLAQFARDMYESKFGDEFGAVMAWIDLQADLKNSEKERLRDIVTNERANFHQEMRLLRASLCEKSLDSLPDDIKQDFLAKFGKSIYDVDAEKVARWDEARRRRTP